MESRDNTKVDSKGRRKWHRGQGSSVEESPKLHSEVHCSRVKRVPIHREKSKFSSDGNSLNCCGTHDISNSCDSSFDVFAEDSSLSTLKNNCFDQQVPSLRSQEITIGDESARVKKKKKKRKKKKADGADETVADGNADIEQPLIPSESAEGGELPIEKEKKKKKKKRKKTGDLVREVTHDVHDAEIDSLSGSGSNLCSKLKNSSLGVQQSFVTVCHSPLHNKLSAETELCKGDLATNTAVTVPDLPDGSIATSSLVDTAQVRKLDHLEDGIPFSCLSSITPQENFQPDNSCAQTGLVGQENLPENSVSDVCLSEADGPAAVEEARIERSVTLQEIVQTAVTEILIGLSTTTRTETLDHTSGSGKAFLQECSDIPHPLTIQDNSQQCNVEKNNHQRSTTHVVEQQAAEESKGMDKVYSHAAATIIDSKPQYSPTAPEISENLASREVVYSKSQTCEDKSETEIECSANKTHDLRNYTEKHFETGSSTEAKLTGCFGTVPEIGESTVDGCVKTKNLHFSGFNMGDQPQHAISIKLSEHSLSVGAKDSLVPQQHGVDEVDKSVCHNYAKKAIGFLTSEEGNSAVKQPVLSGVDRASSVVPHLASNRAATSNLETPHETLTDSVSSVTEISGEVQKTKAQLKAERKAAYEAKQKAQAAETLVAGAAPQKTRAEIRAERRMLQENQRALKQQQQPKASGGMADDSKNKSVDSKSEPGMPGTRVTAGDVPSTTDKHVPAQERKPVAVIPNDSLGKKVTAKKTTPEKEKDFSSSDHSVGHVRLFSHLQPHQWKQSLTKEYGLSGESVHPAIIKVGLQMSQGVVCGSDARCVAMLAALKQVIWDYVTPPQKELSRDLDAKIKPYISFLGKCRPLSVGMSNALTRLKWNIRHVPATESDSEARQSLSEKIDQYITEDIILAKKAISDYAGKKITNGDVILTFACSSLVKGVLCDAFKNGKKFSVIVVDSRPKFEGREMLRCLVREGISCTYALINAVSYVMREATKVILGAHSLQANGYVMSRIGSSLIALVAQAYNVPVQVCCETYKFSERVHTDSIVYNELSDPDSIMRASLPQKCQMRDWKNISSLHLLNLMYDLTPPNLVDMVVTEKGMLPCTSVPVVLRVQHAGTQDS